MTCDPKVESRLGRGAICSASFWKGRRGIRVAEKRGSGICPREVLGQGLDPPPVALIVPVAQPTFESTRSIDDADSVSNSMYDLCKVFAGF